LCQAPADFGRARGATAPQFVACGEILSYCLFTVRSFVPRCGRGHHSRDGAPNAVGASASDGRLLGARSIGGELIGNFRLQTGSNLHFAVILVDFCSTWDFRDRLEIARVIPSWDGAPTRGSRANHLQVVRQICYKRSIGLACERGKSKMTTRRQWQRSADGSSGRMRSAKPARRFRAVRRCHCRTEHAFNPITKARICSRETSLSGEHNLARGRRDHLKRCYANTDLQVYLGTAREFGADLSKRLRNAGAETRPQQAEIG